MINVLELLYRKWNGIPSINYYLGVNMSKLTAIILVASSARTSEGESSVALIFYNEDYVINSTIEIQSYNK